MSVVNLAVRLQHHPSRARELARLTAALDGLDPVAVTDPGGKRPSSWRTHRACLETIPADATHLLVLQDDAIVCDRFGEAVRAAVRERPDTILCLFVPGFAPVALDVNKARKRGDRWMPWTLRSFVPVVGTIYPAAHARALVEFADARKLGPHRADDAIVAAYVRAYRVPVFATVPCLVEHDDDCVSVMRMPVGRRSRHRVAAWFAQDSGEWLESAQRESETASTLAS